MISTVKALKAVNSYENTPEGHLPSIKKEATRRQIQKKGLFLNQKDMNLQIGNIPTLIGKNPFTNINTDRQPNSKQYAGIPNLIKGVNLRNSEYRRRVKHQSVITPIDSKGNNRRISHLSQKHYESRDSVNNRPDSIISHGKDASPTSPNPIKFNNKY